MGSPAQLCSRFRLASPQRKKGSRSTSISTVAPKFVLLSCSSLKQINVSRVPRAGGYAGFFFLTQFTSGNILSSSESTHSDDLEVLAQLIFSINVVASCNCSSNAGGNRSYRRVQRAINHQSSRQRCDIGGAQEFECMHPCQITHVELDGKMGGFIRRAGRLEVLSRCGRKIEFFCGGKRWNKEILNEKKESVFAGLRVGTVGVCDLVFARPSVRQV